MELPWQLNPKESILEEPSGLCFLHISVLQVLEGRQGTGKMVIFSDIPLLSSTKPVQHC